MNITISPGKLSGTLAAPPSKSQAHRFLICAAFAKHPTRILCAETNRDIEATVNCLNSLGAEISRDSRGYTVMPVHNIPGSAHLNCAESGSTLRFLLPVAGALGVKATFHMEGRLPNRPLSPLWEEMERMGCKLSRPTERSILCQGQLKPGKYKMTGTVSSQFISGLLFALPLISGSSDLEITGRIESAPYIHMTRDAISRFSRPGDLPRELQVEGDWSNGAFFLAAQALGSRLEVTNLNRDSLQGDSEVAALLPRLSENNCISAADIPDLVPVLSVVAAAGNGATFTNIRRLRLKESDRVNAVISLLNGLGGKAYADENNLYVSGGGLRGGIVDSCNDHRIAMSAAIAATVCSEEVTILGAESVTKSYPRFWEEYSRLGGNYEQYIR